MPVFLFVCFFNFFLLHGQKQHALAVYVVSLKELIYYGCASP